MGNVVKILPFLKDFVNVIWELNGQIVNFDKY